MCSPGGGDGHVLLAVHAVGDRRRGQRLTHVEVPQVPADLRIERYQLPVVIAEEDYAARRGRGQQITSAQCPVPGAPFINAIGETQRSTPSTSREEPVGLPPNTPAALRPETSGVTGNVRAAHNDNGIITLPEGRGPLALAVFLKDAPGTE
jgi:hypothetical protein